MIYSLRQVDAEYFNRRPCDRCFAVQRRAIPLKVLVPVVGAGIEETCQFVRLGIVAGRVVALVPVAEMAKVMLAKLTSIDPLQGIR